MRRWDNEHSVVIYRLPGEGWPTEEEFARAAHELLAALNPPIPQKRVFVKPNVVWGVAPDSGITVHPAFTGGIVDYLLERGFAPEAIAVGDGGGGENRRDMMDHYRDTGYDRLATEKGFRLVDVNADDYVRVDIPEGVIFKQMPVARQIWDPEAFFLNVPKARTHNFAITTLCLKSLQGLVVPLEERHMCTLFPRYEGDRNLDGIDQSVIDSHERWAHKILDINLARKPDLNLVEMVVGRDGTGFRRGKNRPTRLAFAGRNSLAVDTVVTRIMGFNPDDLTYIRVARERGFGPASLAAIDLYEVVDGALIERDGLDDLVLDPPFRVTLSAGLTYRTYEPVPYNPAEVEEVHEAVAEGKAHSGGGAS